MVKNNKEDKKYAGVDNEKEALKNLLRKINSFSSKTGMYVGVSKSQPSSSKGVYVKTVGRWVTIYCFIYGSDKMYTSYFF